MHISTENRDNPTAIEPELKSQENSNKDTDPLILRSNESLLMILGEFNMQSSHPEPVHDGVTLIQKTPSQNDERTSPVSQRERVIMRNELHDSRVPSTAGDYDDRNTRQRMLSKFVTPLIISRPSSESRQGTS